MTKTSLDSWQLIEQTEKQTDDTEGDMDSVTDNDDGASATDIDSDSDDNSTGGSRLSSTEDDDTE